MKRIAVKKSDVLLILLSCVFLITARFDFISIMFLEIMLLFIYILISVYKNRKISCVAIGFLISFFTFLIGGYLARIIDGEEWTNVFNPSTLKVMFGCLYISLCAIYIGFNNTKIDSKVLLSKESYINYVEEKHKYFVSARYVFYFTIIFSLLVNIERASFVQTYSYLALYTSFKTKLPTYVNKLSQMNTMTYCVMLACLPSKQDFKIPTIIIWIVNSISILAGVRGTVIYYTMLIILYMYYRQNISNELLLDEKWLMKKQIIYIFLLTPICIVFLSMYNSIRNGLNINFSGFKKEILNFFKDQGSSINIIGYAYEKKESLPSTNISYSFGQILAYIKYGFPGRYFFNDGLNLKGNTREMALYGNNLGATISYLVIPKEYLNGAGLGTQYIAELFVDFGYIGVFVFNILLGKLLKLTNFVTNKKWYINAILINIILNIFSIPRNFTFSFFSELVSILNWFTIIFIACFARILMRK